MDEEKKNTVNEKQVNNSELCSTQSGQVLILHKVIAIANVPLCAVVGCFFCACDLFFVCHARLIWSAHCSAHDEDLHVLFQTCSATPILILRPWHPSNNLEQFLDEVFSWRFRSDHSTYLQPWAVSNTQVAIIPFASLIVLWTMLLSFCLKLETIQSFKNVVSSYFTYCNEDVIPWIPRVSATDLDTSQEYRNTSRMNNTRCSTLIMVIIIGRSRLLSQATVQILRNIRFWQLFKILFYFTPHWIGYLKTLYLWTQPQLQLRGFDEGKRKLKLKVGKLCRTLLSLLHFSTPKSSWLWSDFVFQECYNKVSDHLPWIENSS